MVVANLLTLANQSVCNWLTRLINGMYRQLLLAVCALAMPRIYGFTLGLWQKMK